MQVNFDSVAEIKAGEIKTYFQQDGIQFWTRRIAIIGPKGRVDHVVLFGDTEAALQLPGESAMIDPQDFPSQAAYDAACLPATEGTVDLAAEADLQLRFHEWKQIALETIEAATPQVRTIWVHDGQLGFARFMRPGETRREAIACFNADASEGDEARGWRIFENGVQIEAVENHPPLELPF